MASLAFKAIAVGNELRTILAATRVLAGRRFADLLDHQCTTTQAGIDASVYGRPMLEKDPLRPLNVYAGNRIVRNVNRKGIERNYVEIREVCLSVDADLTTLET